MTHIPAWSIYTPSPPASKDPEKFAVVGRLLQHLDAQGANPAKTDAKQKPSQASPANNPPVDLLAKPSSQGRAVETVAFAEALDPPVARPSEGGLGPAQSALESGRPPGQPGPFEVTKIAMTLGGNKVDVYLPKGRGPFPMNIYATGLSHGPRHATANAQHFASWGIMTVVPSLGGNIDPVKSARIIEKIVSDLNQQKEIKGTAVQPEAIAVSGHSFGGLSASMAADHPAVKALLALDPNDNLFQMNPGRRNASQVHVPAAFIFGDGGPNDQGPGIYHELSSPRKYALEFKNMPHDNFISTAEKPNKRGQQRALDFATAFLLHELGGLSATQPYLADGPEIRAAMRKGELKSL